MRGYFRYVARCHRGHLFTEANTRITPEGHQVCRTCDRERKRQAVAQVDSVNPRRLSGPGQEEAMV